MELSGCQGQSQFIHSEDESTAVNVDSKQPDIIMCREFSQDSIGEELSSEEMLARCRQSSPVNQNTIFSEDMSRKRDADFEEEYTDVSLVSKQSDITICRVISPNLIGVAISSEEKLASFRLSLPVSQDTIFSEDKLREPGADFNVQRTAVNVDSKQPDITMRREISRNSIGVETSSDEMLASCRLSSPVSQNTIKSDNNSRKAVDEMHLLTKLNTLVDCREESADVKVDSRKAGIPTCSDISFDSVTLLWGQPKHDPNAIQYYEVKYKIHEDKKWFSVDTKDNVNTFCIEGLKSKTAYDFRVRAVYDDDGDEEEAPLSSICQNIMTKELTLKDRKEECADVKVDSKQAGIPICKDISSDSVTLLWDQPKYDLNSIQYYEVKYKIHEEKKWFSVDTKDNMNTFRIEGLKSKTAYDFRVRAVYDDGDEDEAPLSSICKNIKTKEQKLKDRKEECVDVKVDPKQAGIPICRDISSDSVTLVWDEPQHKGSAIQYYEIKYKLHEDKMWHNVYTKDEKNTFRIEGLKSKNSYDFRVRAVYDDDDDENEAPLSSICKNILTKEETLKDGKEERVDVKVDPKQAGIPICSDISSDSLTLLWSKPQSNVDAIQSYEVKYKIHEEKMWQSVNTKDKKNTFRIESLKSKTAYDFRVRAVYNDDVDEAPLSSICQNIMTKEKVFIGISKGAQNLTDDKPPIYKLPLIVIPNSVNQNAKTRKCVFGNRPPSNFQEKTVMVVGGTGTGKSTMVNAVVNYIMNVNWEDNIRYSIIDLMGKEKENSNDESKSQTEWITCYTIFPQEGSNLDYTFHMIDTPGFGDTGGIEMDRAIVRHLETLFNSSDERGIEILDAVWFVVKATDARLTTSQIYIFDSILFIFGKDIEENIFVVVTFADNNDPPAMKVLKAANVPFRNHFIFNNSSLFVNPDGDEGNDLPHSYWKMSKESFKHLFDDLKITQKRSVLLTAEVLETRRKLEATIQGVQRQIQYGLSKLDTIRQEQRIFEHHAAKVAANEDFTYEIIEAQNVKVDLQTGTHVTNCLPCNTTCHYPCSIPRDEDKSGCAAMRDGNCTVCPKKCPWQNHVNNQYRFEAVLVKVKKTSAEMKMKLGLALDETQKHKTILDKLKEEFDEIRDNVSSSIQYVRESVNRLKQMALKEDPLSHTQYIDLLIECEKTKSKPGFLERMQMLEAMKKQAELLQTLPDTNYDPWAECMSNSSAK